MATNLFEKFGAKFELGQFYPSYENSLKAIVAESIEPHLKKSLVLQACRVAICYWAEGNRSQTRQYASECVKHGMEYFFGKWREEIPTDLKTRDAGWWRIHADWVRPFREAISWATALDDWPAVQRLAEYPLKETKHGVDATREDAAACLALACFLRKAPRTSYEHCFDLIDKGKKEKPKLIAAVVRALQTKNEARFQESLEAYLRYFRRSEFKRTSIDKLLCLDGTTLIKVGEREGLSFKVPLEAADYIVRFS